MKQPKFKTPMPWPPGKLPSQLHFCEHIKWAHFHRLMARAKGNDNGMRVTTNSRAKHKQGEG